MRALPVDGLRITAAGCRLVLPEVAPLAFLAVQRPEVIGAGVHEHHHDTVPGPGRVDGRPPGLFGLADGVPSRDHDVVDTPVSRLALPRHGHFDLGTGYHGDVWLDLDALFLRPALLRPHVRWLADRLAGHRVDAMCGPMEGGAFLAQAIADLLETAFLPAYRAPVRRAGQETAYRLSRVRGGVGGWRVAIADDAVNAGTAVEACSGQVRDCGAVPVAVAALLSLGQASVTMAARLSVPFYAAETIHSQAWPTGNCPLCASGTPLTNPHHRSPAS